MKIPLRGHATIIPEKYLNLLESFISNSFAKKFFKASLFFSSSSVTIMSPKEQ